MTKEELSQCYWLNHEIKQLMKSLKELDGKEYRSINLTGMPHGAGIIDHVQKLATERAELSELIGLKLRECTIARARIERYINDIDDSEMRTILRLRHINGLTWQQVAFSIGENDEQYPRKKYNRFLKLDEKDETTSS